MGVPKKASKQQLEIEGRKLTVSNLDKLMFPAAAFTKAQLIDFYIRVSPHLLPHFAQRPVTLKRFPDGITGEAFYEKDAPGFAPEWITTYPVPRRNGGEPIHYILINDVATLVWCAQAASIELHPFLHRVPELNQPTSIVFDLDPGEGANIVTCIEVAFLLKNVLEHAHLQSFPKVSGSKGIQVYVPLNTPVTYEATRTFARALADLLAKQRPELIVTEMAKSERNKKVFIDWSQNSDFKTTVGVYSMRAKLPRPFVSMPVTWEELGQRKPDNLYFSPQHALERLEQKGDLFGPVLRVKQRLPVEVLDAVPVAKAVRARTASKPRASSQGGRRRFVIQKHAASHLHHDFRLEMHGVLKSWAVPKGLPYELNEKRLAMATEDHPLAYIDFEGVIPPGQYGGGTVMVWDTGTYEVVDGNYYKGALTIFLEGKKLKGEWHIQKEGKAWKITKAGKKHKKLSAKQEDASAVTGRTMQQIADAKDATWHSNRIDFGALPESKLQFVEPMQCKPVAELPEGPDWQYEVKLDGYRALAIRNEDVRLLSRRNNVLNDKFAAIAEALASIEDGCILDGEVVALDESGKPVFNVLQHYRPGHESLVYYVFDVLAYRGRDTRDLPLAQRRQLLEQIVPRDGSIIRLSAALLAKPEELIAAVRQQGLEGLIAKKLSSRYESGERSGSWVKFKTNRGQELVVGGYRPSGKNFFDNLAVGYYDGGNLIFIAKLKNGFTPETKREISKRLEELASDECPFANLPEPKNARRGEAVTAEAMKKYRWIRPELVVQAEYADWTSSNHLRHSKFVGIRDDKDAREVVKESA